MIVIWWSYGEMMINIWQRQGASCEPWWTVQKVSPVIQTSASRSSAWWWGYHWGRSLGISRNHPIDKKVRWWWELIGAWRGGWWSGDVKIILRVSYLPPHICPFIQFLKLDNIWHLTVIKMIAMMTMSVIRMSSKWVGAVAESEKCKYKCNWSINYKYKYRWWLWWW